MDLNQPDVRKLQIGVIVILATIYILRMVTPLRLSTDRRVAFRR